MARSIRRPARLRGTVRPPGDKSISHRAAILNAVASGAATVRRFLPADDCLSTLACLRALGVTWRLADDGDAATLEIEGAGLRGLREPAGVLDAGNSGTTLRLLSGLLAGQPFFSVLTGDASLRVRPVDRIVAPLRLMAAQVEARAGGCYPPLAIRGGQLRGIRYRLPVASAQVKSAVLLAGLYAEGETIVEEPAPARDHTERMLRAMGVDLRREGPGIRLRPPDAPLRPVDLEVPGDLSSAAFWLVGACIHPDAELSLVNVGMNQTRTGLLDVLSMMGAEVYAGEERTVGEEPVADISVRSSRLSGVEVAGDLVPRLIDELPALAVAAVFAEGETAVRDAGELRVKESDRIAALVAQLGRMGARIEERSDGFVVHGGASLRGAPVDGGGDHRLTMALAIAGLVAEGETVVADPESVAVSYPTFWSDLDRVSSSL